MKLERIEFRGECLKCFVREEKSLYAVYVFDWEGEKKGSFLFEESYDEMTDKGKSRMFDEGIQTEKKEALREFVKEHEYRVKLGAFSVDFESVREFEEREEREHNRIKELREETLGRKSYYTKKSKTYIEYNRYYNEQQKKKLLHF